MKKPSFAPLALTMATLLLPAVLQGQSGPEVARAMMKEHEARLARVENVTITQELLGFEATVYMEKQMVNGHPVLVPVQTVAAGRTLDEKDQQHGGLLMPYESQEAFIERARLEGRAEVGGRSCHVLVVEDFQGLDWSAPSGGDGELEPRKGTFYVDRQDNLVRKIVIEGDMRNEGKLSPVTMEATLEDYREVDGFLHPFRTVMNMKGVMEAVGEDFDREEMEQQLAEMREQLEGMPEAQRKMIEGMMGPQMQRIEEMLASSSAEGGMQMVTTVKELKVNAGPPQGSRD